MCFTRDTLSIYTECGLEIFERYLFSSHRGSSGIELYDPGGFQVSWSLRPEWTDFPCCQILTSQPRLAPISPLFTTWHSFSFSDTFLPFFSVQESHEELKDFLEDAGLAPSLDVHASVSRVILSRSTQNVEWRISNVIVFPLLTLPRVLSYVTESRFRSRDLWDLNELISPVFWFCIPSHV